MDLILARKYAGTLLKKSEHLLSCSSFKEFNFTENLVKSGMVGSNEFGYKKFENRIKPTSSVISTGFLFVTERRLLFMSSLTNSIPMPWDEEPHGTSKSFYYDANKSHSPKIAQIQEFPKTFWKNETKFFFRYYNKVPHMLSGAMVFLVIGNNLTTEVIRSIDLR